ncbi:TPA: thermonuclease family protein [Escherichia coli]|nr:thermonuclease family protein [Escherichia coli]HEC5174573.1 thermonuclease family protein [Escherichia coli]
MSLLKKLLLPTLVVLFPAISLAGQPSFEAKVVKIIDGDTITALDEQNTSFKIRLYGIDAPESKQAFGQKAKQALSSAISSQNITVVDHGPDIYGRMLGTIWLDGYDINASMVDSGYAWVYRFDGNAVVPTYLKFEASAQKAVKGLWVDPNPVAPWEWRQQNQKPQKTKDRR